MWVHEMSYDRKWMAALVIIAFLTYFENNVRKYVDKECLLNFRVLSLQISFSSLIGR
jgi:hypothetical protein